LWEAGEGPWAWIPYGTPYLGGEGKEITPVGRPLVVPPAGQVGSLRGCGQDAVPHQRKDPLVRGLAREGWLAAVAVGSPFSPIE
jgi:hypothetical protein